jgi:hypothetical protein
MRATVIMALLLCLLTCREVLADQVVLKNGDRLSGKIVKSDGKSLVIRTEFAGEVTVVWEAVTEVSSDEPLYLALADGRTVSGTIHLAGDQFEVRDGNARTLTAARATVQALRSKEEQAEIERLIDPGLFEAWTGNFNAGLSLATGNAETFGFTLGVAASRTTPRDKTSVYAASIYGRDSTSGFSRTTASVIRAGGPTIDNALLVPLLVMAIGFTLMFVAMHLKAMRNEILRRRVKALQLAEVERAQGQLAAAE